MAWTRKSVRACPYCSKEDERLIKSLVVRVSSFLGAVWPSSIKHETPRSASGGGSGDPVKIGNNPDVKPESSREGSREL